MKIIEELRAKIFTQKSDFLDKLADETGLSEWSRINRDYLSWRGQNDYERVFLSILMEEIYRNLPGYKVVPFVKLNKIGKFSSGERVEITLNKNLEDIREVICWPSYSSLECKNEKCFDGEYPSGTEVDELIIYGQDFCLLEYENQRINLR